MLGSAKSQELGSGSHREVLYIPGSTALGSLLFQQNQLITQLINIYEKI